MLLQEYFDERCFRQFDGGCKGRTPLCIGCFISVCWSPAVPADFVLWVDRKAVVIRLSLQISCLTVAVFNCLNFSGVEGQYLIQPVKGNNWYSACQSQGVSNSNCGSHHSPKTGGREEKATALVFIAKEITTMESLWNRLKKLYTRMMFCWDLLCKDKHFDWFLLCVYSINYNQRVTLFWHNRELLIVL